MNWLDGLLEPLLDRIALKLANKVRAQLNGSMDSALDRAEERIDTAFEGLEERLLAAASKAMEDVLRQATKPIADLKAAVAPVLQLQQQALEAEKLRSEAWAQAAQIQRQAMDAAVSPGKPALELQQQIEALGPKQVQAAAKEAGMIPAEQASEGIAVAAQAARVGAEDQLRSRYVPALELQQKLRDLAVMDMQTPPVVAEALLRPRPRRERPDR